MTEIRIWIGDKEKAVRGVSERTTAADVVISLLKHSKLANMKTIQAHAIYQQWPEFHVPMQGHAKILYEWRRCQPHGVTFHMMKVKSTRPGASADWTAEDTEMDEPTSALVATITSRKSRNETLTRKPPKRRNSFRQSKQYKSQYQECFKVVEQQKLQLELLQSQMKSIDRELAQCQLADSDSGLLEVMQHAQSSESSSLDDILAHTVKDDISALISETCANINDLQLQINSKYEHISHLELQIEQVSSLNVCQICKIVIKDEKCMCTLNTFIDEVNRKTNDINVESEEIENKLSQVEKDIIMHCLKIQRLEFELDNPGTGTVMSSNLRRAQSEESLSLLKNHTHQSLRSRGGETDSDTGLGSLSTEEELHAGLHLVRKTAEFII